MANDSAAVRLHAVILDEIQGIYDDYRKTPQGAIETAGERRTPAVAVTWALREFIKIRKLGTATAPPSPRTTATQPPATPPPATQAPNPAPPPAPRPAGTGKLNLPPLARPAPPVGEDEEPLHPGTPYTEREWAEREEMKRNWRKVEAPPVRMEPAVVTVQDSSTFDRAAFDDAAWEAEHPRPTREQAIEHAKQSLPFQAAVLAGKKTEPDEADVAYALSNLIRNWEHRRDNRNARAKEAAVRARIEAREKALDAQAAEHFRKTDPALEAGLEEKLADHQRRVEEARARGEAVERGDLSAEDLDPLAEFRRDPDAR